MGYIPQTLSAIIIAKKTGTFRGAGSELSKGSVISVPAPPGRDGVHPSKRSSPVRLTVLIEGLGDKEMNAEHQRLRTARSAVIVVVPTAVILARHVHDASSKRHCDG